MRDTELRKLVIVPVSTQPKLEGCWSVNLTDNGIGLVARPASAPLEGESIDIAFPLPADVTIVPNTDGLTGGIRLGQHDVTTTAPQGAAAEKDPAGSGEPDRAADSLG